MEKWRGCNDHQWNVDLDHLVNLALMAQLDKPFDIVVHKRPPKALEKSYMNSEDALVSEIVMRLSNEIKVLLLRNHHLVLSLCIPSPQVILVNEKPQTCVHKALKLCLGHIAQLDQIVEKCLNRSYVTLSLISLRRVGNCCRSLSEGED